MRDGVHLATDVYLPEASGPFPVVLHRLPYGKDQAMSVGDIAAFLDASYAVVIQDTRGRFSSEGEFDPFTCERSDGEDVLAWLVQQRWCEGRVGMVGSSYHGATQWMAAASAPPSLRAIAPGFTSSSVYDGWMYRGGAFQLGFALYWTMGFLALSDLQKRAGPGRTNLAELEELIASIDRMPEVYETLPLAAVSLPAVAGYYAEWLRHPQDDDFWRPLAPEQHYHEVTAPSLNIGGWYDCFLGGTLANYLGMRRHGMSSVSRNPRLIIGPWAHGVLGGEFPELSFGTRAAAAMLPLVDEQIRFFDHHVRGVANGAQADPAVKLFVMGANVWREEESWPIPGTRFVPFYLHSSGRASTDGDGVLSTEVPDIEPPDVFRYDPRDPVPTLGGQTFLPGLRVAANSGPRDQRPVERRPDVLVFTTPQLTGDVDVIGPVVLRLYASSSALDSDFTGKLVDVYPDGRAVILTDGILRARYRYSLEKPQPLRPGEVYELCIDLWATANRFRAGHRIRLEISSSNFPRFDRNTNTGGAIAEEDHRACVVARNTIYHDHEHRSHLLLPLVGEELTDG
jgi:putative CocE/NonD family hydrolase